MLSQSEREYKIAFIESDDIPVVKVSLKQLVELSEKQGADYEWKYAVAEIIDEVMDLKVYENLSFQSVRDNPKSLAIILRWR